MRFHYGEFLNYVEIRKSLVYIELGSVTQWVDKKKDNQWQWVTNWDYSR